MAVPLGVFCVVAALLESAHHCEGELWGHAATLCFQFSFLALCLSLKTWALNFLLLLLCLTPTAVLPYHTGPLYFRNHKFKILHSVSWPWCFITATKRELTHSPRLRRINKDVPFGVEHSTVIILDTLISYVVTNTYWPRVIAAIS